MKQNDKLVRDHHVKQALLKAIRTKRPEPDLPHGPGLAVKGSIMDCDRRLFETMLKTYWDRLFVGWNPFKMNGRGCWEVWQRPIAKSELNDMEHWVADLPFLRLDFVKELQRMDAWEYEKNHGRTLNEDMDESYDKWEEKLEKQEDESIRYAVRHNKSLFGKLKGLAQDGYNPLWFFSDKAQGRGEA